MGNATGTTGATGGGLFGGQQPQAGGGLFGGAQNKPAFGAGTGIGMGTAPGIIPAPTAGGGLFGGQPTGGLVGGTTTTPGGGLFGGQQSGVVGGLLGGQQQQQPGQLGVGATGGLFGGIAGGQAAIQPQQQMGQAGMTPGMAPSAPFPGMAIQGGSGEPYAIYYVPYSSMGKFEVPGFPGKKSEDDNKKSDEKSFLGLDNDYKNVRDSEEELRRLERAFEKLNYERNYDSDIFNRGNSRLRCYPDANPYDSFSRSFTNSRPIGLGFGLSNGGFGMYNSGIGGSIFTQAKPLGLQSKLTSKITEKFAKNDSSLNRSDSHSPLLRNYSMDQSYRRNNTDNNNRQESSNFIAKRNQDHLNMNSIQLEVEIKAGYTTQVEFDSNQMVAALLKEIFEIESDLLQNRNIEDYYVEYRGVKLSPYSYMKQYNIGNKSKLKLVYNENGQNLKK